MALTQLIAALERGAEEEARRIQEEADAEVARLDEDVRARLDGRRAREQARLQERLRGETESRLSAARLEGRRRVLAARDGMLERVLEAARERLQEALVDPRYAETLPSTLEQALGFLPDGGVVHCSPEIAQVVRESVSGSANVEVRPRLNAGTGFMVTSADECIRVDGTLEARLAAVWPELSMHIVGLVEKGAQ
jgi:vacuolar-type H+-ATPase subunit E/Vma4